MVVKRLQVCGVIKWHNRLPLLMGDKVSGLQGYRVMVKFGIIYGKYSFLVGLIE